MAEEQEQKKPGVASNAAGVATGVARRQVVKKIAASGAAKAIGATLGSIVPGVGTVVGYVGTELLHRGGVFVKRNAGKVGLGVGIGAAAIFGGAGAIPGLLVGGLIIIGLNLLQRRPFAVLASFGTMLIVLTGFIVFIGLTIFIINSGGYIVPLREGASGSGLACEGSNNFPSCWPTEGIISQGPEGQVGINCVTSDGAPRLCSHDFFKSQAIDIMSPIGTPVYATHDGTASIGCGDPNYGKCVKIRSADGGFATLYAHMNSISSVVQATGATPIKGGTRIGEIGLTGNTLGPHLHYEVTGRGVTINDMVPPYKVGDRTTGCFSRESCALSCEKISLNPGTRIMPLGDSITAGFGSAGYRAPLFDLLKNANYQVDFVGSIQGPGPDPDHEGHVNQPPKHLADNIEGWLDASKPDIVLLHTGTVLLGSNFDANVENVGNILTKINQKSPNTKIIMAKIIRRLDQVQNVTRFNAAIAGLAGSHKNVIVVDMEGALSYPADLLPDGIHPNPKGYEKMASIWFNALTTGTTCGGGQTIQGAALENTGLSGWIIEGPIGGDNVVASSPSEYGSVSCSWSGSKGLAAAVNANFFDSPTRPSGPAGYNGVFTDYASNRSSGSLFYSFLISGGAGIIQNIGKNLPSGLSLTSYKLAVSGVSYDSLPPEPRPRTVLGYKDGKIYLVVLQSASPTRTKSFMNTLGFSDSNSFMLDGGGSTTMCKGATPLFGNTRTVATSIGVRSGTIREIR